MRRGMAAVILGLSLVMATVAWSGFVLTRTALDPERSERLADQLFDNEVLRGVLIDRIADAMNASIPGDVAIPRQILEQAAAVALDEPTVQNLVRGGIVDMHRSALEGNAEPVTIDAAALGSASRAALVSVQPQLDAVLPAAPSLEVELPVGGLSVLGTLRSFTVQVTQILGVAAVAGAALAFVIARNRPAVLRRVAFWAFGAALFWVIVGFGVPFLAERLAPASLAVIAAITDVFFGAMIQPGLFMAGFGAALLGASYFWAAGSAAQGARILQPRNPRTHTAPGQAPGPADYVPPRAAPHRVGTTQSNIRRPTGSQPPVQAPVHQPMPGPGQPMATPRAGDPTTVYAQPQRPATPVAGEPTPLAPAPRWEPGVGYIDDDSTPAPRRWD